MKELKKGYKGLRNLTNAISKRVLKMIKAEPWKEATRWTPYEGIPVSVPLADLEKTKMV
jgi:hypothetical protein